VETLIAALGLTWMQLQASLGMYCFSAFGFRVQALVLAIIHIRLRRPGDDGASGCSTSSGWKIASREQSAAAHNVVFVVAALGDLHKEFEDRPDVAVVRLLIGPRLPRLISVRCLPGSQFCL